MNRRATPERPPLAEEESPSRPGPPSCHQLWWLLAASVLRFLVGTGAYLLAWRAAPSDPLPLLNSWLLTTDATQYHVLAQRIADFWAGQSATLSLGLPDKFLGYPVILGMVYFLLGPHPLWGLLLNSLAFLAMGLLARRLALRLGRPPAAALALALLVALWPVSLSYSSALLKDSLNLLAVFLLLATFADLLTPDGREGNMVASWAGLGLLLGAYGIVVLRPECAPVVAFVTLSAIAWSALGGLPRWWERTWRPMAAGLLVAAGIFLGINYSPVRLLPAHPLAAPAPPSRAAAAPAIQVMRAASLAWPSQLTQRVRAGLDDLWHRRWEYATSGGVSLLPEAYLLPDKPKVWATILGASLRNLLLYPLPWQRWPSGGDRVLISLAITAQSLLWYALLPGLAWGLVEALRSRSTAGPPVLLWVAVVGPLLALMIVNLGTLYRIRDLALLPSLLLFSSAPYRWLWDKLLSSSGPPRGSPTG